MSKEPGSSVVSRFPASGPRLLCCVALVVLFLAGITALTLYLVYRPSNPKFTILTAAIYHLSNSSSSSSSTTTFPASLQFTVAIRNPSPRSSIDYDRLSAYASYRGEAVTPAVPLPSLSQERDSTVALSPVLGGGCAPVSAAAAAGLAGDEAYGVVGVRLVMTGRLRYRSGPFRSGWYGMYLRCDVLLCSKKGVDGQVPMLGDPDCDVEV